MMCFSSQRVGRYMVGITVQVQSGLGLPYGFGAEAGLPLPLRAAWNALVGPLAGFIPTLSPLFDEVPVQKIKDLMAHAEAVSGQSAPDLLRWYAVDPGPIDPQFVAAAISALPFVTQAAVQGPAEVTLTPHLNPQFPAQRYLLDAPEGIDAKHAWSLLGGQGVGVLIIDVEHGWWPDHEDLADVRVEVLGGIPDRLDRHGTSVFGILAATDNTKGIIGIAPAANLALSPLRRAPGPGIVNPEKNLLNAIFRAMMRQTREPDRPMVLLIEVGGEIESGKKNALPPSIELCVPDLIQMAVQEGITVIEAAGNGNVDLDAYTRNGVKPFQRGARDTGSIMVAATGAGMSLTKTTFSSFGSRVDCFAWGEGVRTCEFDVIPSTYGDFSGTSAATAIVAGAAALIQSVAMIRTGSRLSPKRMRELMADRSLNTLPAPGQPPIGVMPNLRNILATIPVGP